MSGNALHFVGFVHPDQGSDALYDRAVRVFGKPDFVHRRWDERARQEIAPGDTVIFTRNEGGKAPNLFAFDDSGIV